MWPPDHRITTAVRPWSQDHSGCAAFFPEAFPGCCWPLMQINMSSLKRLRYLKPTGGLGDSSLQ
jgi:hypothetical protein